MTKLLKGAIAQLQTLPSDEQDAIARINMIYLHIVRLKRLQRRLSKKKKGGYFGVKLGKITIAVAPNYTSQNCSQCGKTVKKSLSMRTHICSCGCQLDRDENAAINA
jgi:transposase